MLGNDLFGDQMTGLLRSGFELRWRLKRHEELFAECDD